MRKFFGNTVSWVVESEARDAAGRREISAEIIRLQVVMRKQFMLGEMRLRRNAFYCMKESVTLHKIQIFCPKIATFLINLHQITIADNKKRQKHFIEKSTGLSSILNNH